MPPIHFDFTLDKITVYLDSHTVPLESKTQLLDHCLVSGFLSSQRLRILLISLDRIDQDVAQD